MLEFPYYIFPIRRHGHERFVQNDNRRMKAKEFKYFKYPIPKCLKPFIVK